MESVLPVLYKGDITVEMVDRMFSLQLSQLRNEMKEMREEMKRRVVHRGVDEEQKGVNEGAWALSVEVNRMKREMGQIVEKQKKGKWKLRQKLSLVNDRVDGVKSDLHVETTRLRNEIKEIQKQPMRSDFSESISLAVEENKAKILELKGKTDTWFEIVDSNYRKNNDLMNQSKHEFSNELKSKENKLENKMHAFEQTMKGMDIAREKKWMETNDRVDQCLAKVEKDLIEMNKRMENIKKEINDENINVTQRMRPEMTKKIEEYQKLANQNVKELISPLSRLFDEKVSELNAKIVNLELKTEENRLITQLYKSIEINNLEPNEFNSETFQHFAQFQMNTLNLVENEANFRPDFTWEINEISDKITQEEFEIKSQVFQWSGYTVQAQVLMKGRSFNANLSLCLEEFNRGKTINLKLIPQVYYVLRDRTSEINPKHRICSPMYFNFTFKFNYSCKFNCQICPKTYLNDPVYKVDDSVVIDVYVEPPTMAQFVLSYDGTLTWAIDRFKMRKRMEKNGLVPFHESPYFYTGLEGYRVQITMKLLSGLKGQVRFLSGEFDADLPLTFPHQTTVIIFNRKDPRRNIVKTVDKDIQTNKYYYIDLISEKEIESLAEDDVLFYKVVIKSMK